MILVLLLLCVSDRPAAWHPQRGALTVGLLEAGAGAAAAELLRLAPSALLYYTILQYTVIYYTILYYTILY